MKDALREAVRRPGCWSTALFVVAAFVAAFIVWRSSAARAPWVIGGADTRPVPTVVVASYSYA